MVDHHEWCGCQRSIFLCFFSTFGCFCFLKNKMCLMVVIQWGSIVELIFVMEQFHNRILVVLGGRWHEGRLKNLVMVGFWNFMVVGNGCNSCYKEWYFLVGRIISMVKQKEVEFSSCCFGRVKKVKFNVVNIRVLFCV